MTRIGDIIDNRYEILKEIGRGGMSVVYLAMDKRINKQWAIKELQKKAMDGNHRLIEQNPMTEGDILKKLDHPTLPRIFDIVDNGDTIYMIMDYIEGESLDHILDTYGRQPQENVIEWAKQLCDVLRYLHGQNPPIIYRDMKPANIMLRPEGNVKLIDFGVAREFKEQNVKDTGYMGTMGYAAPEQFGGRGQTDARTDIYCLGVTLYHMITGIIPSEDSYEIRPIRSIDSKLSGGLEKIIYKCTRPSPADRYQNCDELMYALEHYEEEDDAYRKMEKRKVGVFIGLATMAIILLTAGGVTRFLGNKTQDNDYESKLEVERSLALNTRLESYLEAMDLVPGRMDAYRKYIEACNGEGNGRFTEEESAPFIQKYETNKEAFDTSSEEYYALNYEIGEIFLNLYDEDGKDDEGRQKIQVREFRQENVQKAMAYFEKAKDAKIEEFGGYKRETAQAYYEMCDFLNRYVLRLYGEPTQDNYEAILKSFEIIIDNMSDKSAYMRLSIYQKIQNFLLDGTNLRNMAVKGIAEDNIKKREEKLHNIINEMPEKLENDLYAIWEEIFEDGKNADQKITEAYVDVKKEAENIAEDTVGGDKQQ